MSVGGPTSSRSAREWVAIMVAHFTNTPLGWPCTNTLGR